MMRAIGLYVRRMELLSGHNVMNKCLPDSGGDFFNIVNLKIVLNVNQKMNSYNQMSMWDPMPENFVAFGTLRQINLVVYLNDRRAAA